MRKNKEYNFNRRKYRFLSLGEHNPCLLSRPQKRNWQVIKKAGGMMSHRWLPKGPSGLRLYGTTVQSFFLWNRIWHIIYILMYCADKNGIFLTLVMLNKSRCHAHINFDQSDYLIQVVDINAHSNWQTVQIQISWLLQKLTDLDLHCLQRQGISGLNKTRVNSLKYF